MSQAGFEPMTWLSLPAEPPPCFHPQCVFLIYTQIASSTSVRFDCRHSLLIVNITISRRCAEKTEKRGNQTAAKSCVPKIDTRSSYCEFDSKATEKILQLFSNKLCNVSLKTAAFKGILLHYFHFILHIFYPCVYSTILQKEILHFLLFRRQAFSKRPAAVSISSHWISAPVPEISGAGIFMHWTYAI